MLNVIGKVGYRKLERIAPQTGNALTIGESRSVWHYQRGEPMTRIDKRKTKLTAETSATFRGRELIVELTPYCCLIRQKGKRIRYAVDWNSVYTLGALKAAEKLRADRKAARAARGKG